MKIVADENIPLINECFGSMGEIIRLPGRAITSGDVKQADALLVRSVTRVDEALVAGSSLKFVGTATAGVDHIDQSALADRGIGFVSAPGCNATAVSEYVLCALDILAERYRFNLEQRTFGIVGKGQVGSRLMRTLQGLGYRVLVNDPLCERVEGVEFVELDQLIQCCDVLSLHTPLTTDGPFPTHHLINDQRIKAMKPGTVLVSAGRGAVVDNDALRNCLKQGQDLKVVMDVWEHEPSVDHELLGLVDLASPHIAGYSLDGKVTGTEMIYKAFCQYFGLPARVRTAAITPMAPLRMISFTENSTVASAASTALRAIYDIRRDDAWMRRLPELEKEAARLEFDRMRKSYPVRRELSTLKVRLKHCGEEMAGYLAALGLVVVMD
ncbi:4-phosphoerythronate dehydrogenase PdxB [Endozoicomonas sp. Mp262]|uniref:4-phosphoerythronate dehydrogenase PdxB n=1 Tax=Endozoicomonas sp. Mp262 TaxID=2919499 RepID=UPI0021D832D5